MKKYLIELEITDNNPNEVLRRSEIRKITVDVKEDMTNELLEGFCKQTEQTMGSFGLKCTVKPKGFWELKGDK